VRRTKLEYRDIYESDPVNKATPDSDAGFVKILTDARSVNTAIKRDVFGRPLKVIEAQNVADVEASTGFAWDGNGGLTALTPPSRPAHQLFYDGINRLQQYTPPVLPDVSSPETKFTSTADRAADTETRPGGVVITHTYVNSTSTPNTGRLDTITFPGGLVDFDYYSHTDTNQSLGQAPGKVKSISGPYGGVKVKFDYDGSLSTKVTWTGVAATNEASGAVSWGYDSFFRRISEAVTPVSGAAVSRFFTYDNDNLLTCISVTAGVCSSGAGSADLSLTRSTEHGAVTAMKIGGATALTEIWSYSDSAPDGASATDTDGDSGRFGELRSQDLQYGNPAISRAKVTYDAPSDPRDTLGRIEVKTEAFAAGTTFPAVNNEIVYEYDERGRLLSAENTTSGIREEFEYDANGNRTRLRPTPGVALAGKYDDQDRLTFYGVSTDASVVGDFRFTYGPNGELKQREKRTSVNPSTFASWKYTYDALGNLVSVETPGAAKTYGYLLDGLGRRIGKTEKTGAGQPVLKKRWLYGAALGPVAELDAAGVVTARFVYGSRSNVPDLVIKGGKTYRLFSDQLGSPRMAINVNTPTEIPYRVDYSAFGVPTWKGNPQAPDLGWIPFGFAGGLYDAETELVRFGARDYDASIGRWVSKDPILFGGGQANLYVYVNNDPINYRDPSGLLVDSVFGWGALGLSWPFGSPVQVGGEGVAVAGYSATDGWFGGGIVASGVHAGPFGAYLGTEGTACSKTGPHLSGIMLGEIHIPGLGWTVGGYRNSGGEYGLFAGKDLGESTPGPYDTAIDRSAGVGVGLDAATSASIDWWLMGHYPGLAGALGVK
jgi:RHS repeat-associated protein